MENMQIYITFLVLMTIGACFFFIKVNKNIKKEKKIIIKTHTCRHNALLHSDLSKFYFSDLVQCDRKFETVKETLP